jgi:hypothetical protein
LCEALSHKYKCSERAVAKVAKKERWQSRLDELEARARAKSDQQILESLEQMNDRHIRTARMLQAKGIAALQSLEIKGIPDALKAVQVGLEKERLIRGEPSERVNIEEIVRAEYETWMVDDDQGEETLENGSVP